MASQFFLIAFLCSFTLFHKPVYSAVLSYGSQYKMNYTIGALGSATGSFHNLQQYVNLSVDTHIFINVYFKELTRV